jgi:3-(3-hydroxy-phenyl)propionate hydroxylase
VKCVRSSVVQHVDVVVVGLGPTGATLAGLLGQRGLKVAAFDRLPDLYPSPRAIGFDHDFMRVMQELGIADRVLVHTAPYRPSEYQGVEGQLIKRLDAAAPPHKLGWAPNYVFDQPSVERVLRDRLAEIQGVEVQLSAEVTGVDDVVDGVVVTVAQADGSITEFHAQYVVASDGGSSPIRKRLGIALDDLDFDEHWLVVDATVNNDVLERLPQTQVQYCEPARPSSFVIGPGNHRRWEVMLLPGDSLSEDFPENELWPLLARWIKPGDAMLRRAAAYRFHGLVAQRWRAGRILLAGDSAHMTPPFMAQGMVQGIRDAQNLAWKLPLVIAGDASPALLDTYGTERSPHVRATTALAIGLGRVICERDPAAAVERDHRLIAEQGGSVQTTVRQSMLPSLSHGLLALGSPGAGESFPQPTVVVDGRTALLDDVTGPRVRVIVTERADIYEVRRLATAAAAIGGVVVVLRSGGGTSSDAGCLVVYETEPLIAGWLADLGSVGAVVRPDHVVFGTADCADALVELLELLSSRVRSKA